MTADASAYAVLGLAPDADGAAIETAYKRLIKEHHPDRSGGEARRAAEINRAYQEIRAKRNLTDPLELNEDRSATPGNGRAFVFLALIVAGGVGLLAVTRPSLSSGASTGVGSHRPSVTARGGDPMDQPLDLAAIDTASADALRLARTRDEMALASASRNCHRALRNNPSLAQLDRCAAFDDAVVELEDRDPLRDQGPFGELAVTGRLWSGATALSSDDAAIDGRLDRIRLRVEQRLAPPAESSAN